MNGFVEQSADGGVLEWRPHDLAGVATLRGLPELEPRMLAGERAAAGFPPLAADLRGLRWNLSGWEALEITPADGSALVVRRRADPPAITWRELGDPGAVEATPRRADGTAGITRRIERPRLRVRFLPVEERLIVRVEGAEASARVRVELFEQGDYPRLHATGDGRRLTRRGDALEATLDLGHAFFGVVAVVESTDSRQRLLDWRSWVEGRLLGRGDATIAAHLRRKVERTPDPLAGGGGSFAAWPPRSRERLAWLADRAGWLTETTADTAGLGHLTGVFRAVFLAELGAVAEKPSPDSARRLSEGPFLAALGRLWPTLASRLRDARDDESRLRILQPNEEAPPADPASSIARKRRPRGPPGSTASPRGSATAARRPGRSPLARGAATARRNGGAFGRRAGRDHPPRAAARARSRPASSARHPPPLSREAYAKWEQARDARADWRRGLARISAYCETGDWPAGVIASADGTLPPSFDLQRRLALPRPAATAAPGGCGGRGVGLPGDRPSRGGGGGRDRPRPAPFGPGPPPVDRPTAGRRLGRLAARPRRSRTAAAGSPLAQAELPALEAGAPLAERGAVAGRFLAVCDEITRRTAAWGEAGSRWRALFKAPDKSGLRICCKRSARCKRAWARMRWPSSPR